MIWKWIKQHNALFFTEINIVLLYVGYILTFDAILYYTILYYTIPNIITPLIYDPQVIEIDPGHFREIDEAIRAQTKGKALIEIVSVKNIAEGDQSL